ncbi:MAG: SDR family NAD(P)-dependent oxidoreductase [Eubacteriales bacterium]|nr:SDR family NAD(P)-dependent oxidoreductase [Eubacteriales bacterium]
MRRPLALVTGASRGIGLAIAGALAAEGYDLILTCSRTLPALEEAAAQIARSHGVFCRTFLCDGGDPEAVEALFAVLGTIPLTLLVNNAGISHIGLLQEMTVPEWNRVISTNLSSCFYFCRAAIPLFLRRTTGSIINISSVWGSAGASMEVAYSASKGGVNAFTKALAKELAPSGIPVNALACGVVDTEMNQCFSEEEREALRGEIPADRFASPDEIARAVVHLAQMPSYLTGQVITIDGGWI